MCQSSVKGKSEEIIIAQSGGYVESQISLHSYALIVIILLVVLALLFLARNRCRSTLRSWLRQEMVNQQPVPTQTLGSVGTIS